MTDWFIAGLGAVVTTAGALAMRRRKGLGSGIMGFGLAHILLGAIDRIRHG